MGIECVWRLFQGPRHGLHRSRIPGIPWDSGLRQTKSPGALPKESWAILPLEADEPNDASSFVDCIENQEESEMNAAVAAHLTEILLAGYKSAASGEVVELPLERGE